MPVWIASPEAWIALATLTALAIVLGTDNIIFIPGQYAAGVRRAGKLVEPPSIRAGSIQVLVTHSNSGSTGENHRL